MRIVNQRVEGISMKVRTCMRRIKYGKVFGPDDLPVAA